MSATTGSITIDFHGDGSTTIEGSGFVGKSCDKAMEEIEDILGKQVSRANKADYNRKPPQKQQATQ